MRLLCEKEPAVFTHDTPKGFVVLFPIALADPSKVVEDGETIYGRVRPTTQAV